MQYSDEESRNVLAETRAMGGGPSMGWCPRLNLSIVFCCICLIALVVSASFGNAYAAQVCPILGADTDCGVYIKVTDTAPRSGLITFKIEYPNPPQPPFDGVEDTLVGIVNNSSQSLSSIKLRSAKRIFDFNGEPGDPDGICLKSPLTGQPVYNGTPFQGWPGKCPFGQPGDPGLWYQGPGTRFVDIAPDFKSGKVLFDPPLAPGGSTFFSLEESLTAQPFSCSEAINGAVVPTAHPAGTPMAGLITATFKPQKDLNLQQAAQACGFIDFNWSQQHVTQFNPAFYKALNQLGPDGKGIFDPSSTVPVLLDASRTPFNDPPQGGGYVNPLGQTGYTFYYIYPTELATHQTGGFTLAFKDAPTDPCLRDSTVTLCPNRNQRPMNDYNAYRTRLVGVLNAQVGVDLVDLEMMFDWRSNWTGSSGGTYINPKTDNLPDNNGTGGVTVTAVHNVTSYQYNDFVVTTINDKPVTTDAPPDVTVSASPSQLWPPRPWLVPVTISGTITDLDESKVNPSTVAYVVEDEYGLVQPKGPVTLGANGQYSFTVELQPTRKGDDKDGRLYTIRVSATDTAGNMGLSSATVIVPHDEEHHRKHRHKHDREHDRDHDRKDDRGHQRDDQDHDERDDRRH